MVLIFQTCIRISFLASQKSSRKYFSCESTFSTILLRIQRTSEITWRSNHMIGQVRSSDSLCSEVTAEMWLAKKNLSGNNCRIWDVKLWIWFGILINQRLGAHWIELIIALFKLSPESASDLCSGWLRNWLRRIQHKF